MNKVSVVMDLVVQPQVTNEQVLDSIKLDGGFEVSRKAVVRRAAVKERTHNRGGRRFRKDVNEAFLREIVLQVDATRPKNLDALWRDSAARYNAEKSAELPEISHTVVFLRCTKEWKIRDQLKTKAFKKRE